MFARLNGFVLSVKIPFAGKMFVKEISGALDVDFAEGSSWVFEGFFTRPRLGLGGSADVLPIGCFNLWGLEVRARDSISNLETSNNLGQLTHENRICQAADH